MKKDILGRQDIVLLVDRFYERVRADALLGGIFTDVAHVKWEHHLPVMYDFWENALFFTGNYTGNPMELHHHLSRLMPLHAAHFDRWNMIFITTVDRTFKGPNADTIKNRAIGISEQLKERVLKLQQDERIF